MLPPYKVFQRSVRSCHSYSSKCAHEVPSKPKHLPTVLQMPQTLLPIVRELEQRSARGVSPDDTVRAIVSDRYEGWGEKASLTAVRLGMTADNHDSRKQSDAVYAIKAKDS